MTHLGNVHIIILLPYLCDLINKIDGIGKLPEAIS